MGSDSQRGLGAQAPSPRFFLALCLALCSLGCWLVDDEPKAPGSSDGAKTTTGATAALAAGSYWIDSSERGVSVRANGAALREVLDGLGRELGFEIVAGLSLAERRVSLDVAEQPIEAVLARLLGGISYTLSYETAAEADRSVLRRLRIVAGDIARAERRSRDKSGSGDARAQARTERRERRRAEDPSERKLAAARKREQVIAERRAREPETLAALESSDPSEREAAVWDLDPASGYERAADLLHNDPDPGVRAAALDRVFRSNAAGSVPEVLKATRDSDPEVVIEALDLLEFDGDASILPELEHLREHPDPRVREKFAETSDFISD